MKHNACRFRVDMALYPRIESADKADRALEAFAKAALESQPDYEQG
jgi:hypothetical protein